MEEEKTSSFLTALKLDDFTLANKFIYVEELDNADGSFIISSIIKDQIEKNCNVILVLCHNSIGHFHSISQKLGYNLMSLKDSGEVFVVDIMEKIINDSFIFAKEPLRNLYADIKEQIQNWNDDEKGVTIVVENLGNLLLVNIEDLLNFIHYLRGIIFQRKNSTLLCSMHNFSDSLDFKNITGALKHVADIVVTLKELTTGRANDVTGHLTIKTKDKKFVMSTSEYQYLLQDKAIHIFTSGSVDFFFKR